MAEWQKAEGKKTESQKSTEFEKAEKRKSSFLDSKFWAVVIELV